MSHLANLLITGRDQAQLDDLIGFLRARDYTVMTCATAERTLEEVRRGHPDLAIVDLATMGDEGFRLVAEIAGSIDTDHIPALLIGADGSPRLYRQASEAGADDIFMAPLDHAAFLARMTPLLRLSTMHEELHRRVALAERFGVAVEDHADLSPGGEPLDILVVGSGDAFAAPIEEALGSACAITACDDIFVAEDRLYESFFDACAVFLGGDLGFEPCLELCAQIRNNPRLFNLPVVVVAPPGALPEDAEPYTNGVTRLITAPAEDEELRYVMTSLVNRQRERWKIRQAMDTTKTAAVCDPLTGSYTFDFLRAHLEILIESARTWEKHLTLVFFSIPGVADVRHQFGDVAADHLLHQLAQWIAGPMRVEDLTARYGEYDFCVALPDTPLVQAEIVMRRVAGIISHTDFALHKVYQPITVSVEVSLAALEEDTADSLVTRARTNLE